MVSTLKWAVWGRALHGPFLSSFQLEPGGPLFSFPRAPMPERPHEGETGGKGNLDWHPGKTGIGPTWGSMSL